MRNSRASTFPFMTWTKFCQLIQSQASPVILLEGRRSIPPPEAMQAARLARFLAEQFPQARFRSGNAEGSDAAFSEGVALVDPQRLEVVTPYPGHRKKARVSGASYASPEDMDRLCEPDLLAQTVQATPANRRLIEAFGKPGPGGAKAAYLVRDTLKVVGIEGRLNQPTAALFWVDLQDPEAGGTGHTIRVCQQLGVPIIFQTDWATWAPPPGPVVYPPAPQKNRAHPSRSAPVSKTPPPPIYPAPEPNPEKHCHTQANRVEVP